MRALVALLTASLVMTSVAFGDTITISNTINLNDQATVLAGGSGTAHFRLEATNGTPVGDTNGCNAQSGTNANGSPLVVSIQSSNPKVTLAATTVTFTDCAPQAGGLASVGYTVAADAADESTATIAVTGTSGGKTDGTRLYQTTDTLVVTVDAPTPSDTTAPDTSITAGPSGTVASSSASFEFTATETATFECSLDGAAYGPCTSPQGYTLLADGTHTFEVRATDTAGNTDGSPASRTWTVDTTAPDTSITDGPAGSVSSTSASFTFTSPESGATFQCRLDGAAFAACTSPQNYTGLSEGSHTFDVRAVDAVGNADASPASRTWTVDTLAPAVSAPDLDTASDTGSSSTDNLTNDANPDFSGTAEAGATVELLRDGTAVASGTAAGDTTWSLTDPDASPDGTYSYTARATDAAGNSTTSSALSVEIDTTDPAVSLDDFTDPIFSGNVTAVSAEGTGEEGATIDLTLSDEDALTADITASAVVDSDGNWSITGIDASSLADGDVTFSVTATDAAGNASDPDTGTALKDTVAPAVSAPDLDAASDTGSSNSDDLTKDSTPTFTGTAEAGATVELFEGTTLLGSDTADADGDWTITSSALLDGSHTVIAKATDGAGNSTTSAGLTIQVDTAAPSTPAFVGGPASGASYVFGSVPAAPTCTSTDAISGPAPCTVTGYGANVGPHTMTASATDAAGNTASALRSYTVAAWTLRGFFAPVDMGMLNTVKGGSTVPLKFEVFAGSTELTTTDAIQGFEAWKVGCVSGVPTDDIELVTTGGTILRYDGTGGQFIQNWKTPTASGCYQVKMTTQDGSFLTAMFKTR